MAVEFSFRFPLPQGLHARPAVRIQETADRFVADIFWDNLKTAAVADAKSVLSLIGSDTQCDDPCRLRLRGPDEQDAREALIRLLLEDLPITEARIEEALPSTPADVPRVLVLEKALFFRGTPAGAGIAFGPVRIHDPGLEMDGEEVNRPAESVEVETAVFRTAAGKLEAEILRQRAEKSDPAELAVLDSHLALVRDRALIAKIEHFIAAEKNTAGTAIARAGREFGKTLQAARSAYIRERVADIKDVSRRLRTLIEGGPGKENAVRLDGPVILAAADLTPSEFLALDRNLLLGLILENAGTTSHTLILARARGIPAVSGCTDIRKKLQAGENVILDGGRGFVLPSPSPAVERYFERDTAAETRKNEKRLEKAGLPGRTEDGCRMEIAANIGHAEELQKAWVQGAEGVGLFRTEMLLMDRATAPDEDEQYAVYVQAVRAAGGRPVIIRTFDIGGDKPIPFLPLPRENNPFLGVRGIRLYERCAGLIQAQLRAILRAAVFGPLKIMFPMVGTLDEIIGLKDLLRTVAGDLAGASIPHRPAIETGMMVEVPSAALLIDGFADQVDFFSIGSNDLLQYFFAADRGNPGVRDLNQPLHPAFLRLLRKIVEDARAKKRWVGLCGEIAADPRLLPLWVGLGFDELSMAPAAIPEIKARLAGLKAEDCRSLAQTAVGLWRRRDVEAALDAFGPGEPVGTLIEPDLVRLDSASRSKAETMQELASLLELSGRAAGRTEIEAALWRREDTGSTGIGLGVAIPHCQTAAIRSASIAVLRFARPFPWDAGDDEPVDLAVMLAIPAAGPSGDHLKLLARLSRRLMHDEFREALRAATDADSLARLIAAAAAG